MTTDELLEECTRLLHLEGRKLHITFYPKGTWVDMHEPGAYWGKTPREGLIKLNADLRKKHVQVPIIEGDFKHE